MKTLEDEDFHHVTEDHEDEIETTCSNCHQNFWMLREQYEADLQFDENPEETCPDCTELPCHKNKKTLFLRCVLRFKQLLFDWFSLGGIVG